MAHILSKLVLSGLLTTSLTGAVPSPDTEVVLGLHQPSHESINSPTLITQSMVDYIEGLMDRWDLQGVSLGLVREIDGEWVRESTGFGIKDRHNNSMDENTLFAIASNSKLFASISAGLLIHNETATYTSLQGSTKGQQKRLTWETKVADVIPEWKLPDEYASEHSSLIDLMGHRTGMPRHDNALDIHKSTEELTASMRHMRKSRELREAYQYNNFCFNAASLLTNYVAGVPYVDYVQRYIFDAVGMNNSFIDLDATKATGLMGEGFTKHKMDEKLCVKEWEESGEVKLSKECRGPTRSLGWWQSGNGHAMAGSAGITTSSHDLTLWLQTLLTGGISPTTGEQVIPSEVIHDVIKARNLPEYEPSFPEMSILTYGMAQRRGLYRGVEYIEHGGSVPGQMTQVVRLPSKKIGVAILANDDELGTLAANTVIKFRIIDEMLGLEPIDWETRMLNQTLTGFKKALAKQTPKPKDAAPPTDSYNSLQGVYSDGGGYGEMRLCLEPHSVASLSEDVIVSEECGSIIADSPFTADVDGSTAKYVVRLDKVWASYMELTHFSENNFNISIATKWPDTGIVSERHALDMGVAKFGDGGLGLGGNYWGAGLGSEPTFFDGGVEASADVFFKKIE